MSQPHHDSFRPKRAPAKDLSAPQLRALRKELLLVRADVERAELFESYVQVRQGVTHFSWLRFLLPSLRRSRGGPLGGSFGGPIGATVGGLLKQYPMLSSLLSLVLAKPLRAGVVSTARPLIKWAGIAFTAWEGYRIWQQVRKERAPGSAARSARAGEGERSAG